MSHPADEVLLQALHEPASASAVLRAHLEHCEACRQRQEQLLADDRFVAGLFDALDHSLPVVTLDDVRPVRSRVFRRRALLVAELTLFLAAAAAAMTISSSPLHKLLFPARPAQAVNETPVDAAPTTPTLAAPVGIALAAPDSLVVEFRQPQAAGTLEVRLTDGNQVTVSSRGGTVGYRVNEGRVQVDNRVPADEYVIEIPSALRRAEILMGTHLLFHKDGDRTVPQPSAGNGHYHIVLGDSTRSQP